MTVETGEDTKIVDMDDEPQVTEVPFSEIDPRITPDHLIAWDKILDPLITADNNEFGVLGEGDVVLEVGKYEPPHRGHAFQLYAGAKKANLYAENAEDRATFVVVVGNPKEKKPAFGSPDDQKYPFSFDERVELLKHMAKRLKLSDEVIANNLVFVPISDVGNNKQWVEKIITEVETVRGLGIIRTIFANDFDTKFSTRTAFRENSDKRILGVDLLPGQATGTDIRNGHRVTGVLAPGGRHRVAWNR